MPQERRKPRTVDDVRKFMRDVGPIGTSVMASAEPITEQAQRAAERVAERLVGGLAAWRGMRDERVALMTTKLVRLQRADASERGKACVKKVRG
jgi:hypothetical protein